MRGLAGKAAIVTGGATGIGRAIMQRLCQEGVAVTFSGISDGVLAGGQYDKLMSRMGRNSGAIGFAVYLDLLENLHKNTDGYDVDTLIVYDDKTNVTELADKVQALTENGERVSAQKTRGKIRAKNVLDMTGGEKC